MGLGIFHEGESNTLKPSLEHWKTEIYLLYDVDLLISLLRI